MMNERIRELADQACVVVRFNIHPHTYMQIDDPNGMYARLELNKEKFAELIVRECIDQCEEIAVSADKIANGQLVTDAGRMLHQGMWGGAKNCIVQIKEHFGVEE